LPVTRRKGGEAVRAFNAIGRVKPDEPYPFDMGNGFVPPASTSIRLMTHRSGRSSTDRHSSKTSPAGHTPFRFGILKVTKPNFVAIAKAMELGPDLTD
jgi:hypothetical protein